MKSTAFIILISLLSSTSLVLALDGVEDKMTEVFGEGEMDSVQEKLISEWTEILSKSLNAIKEIQAQEARIEERELRIKLSVLSALNDREFAATLRQLNRAMNMGLRDSLNESSHTDVNSQNVEEIVGTIQLLNTMVIAREKMGTLTAEQTKEVIALYSKILKNKLILLDGELRATVLLGLSIIVLEVKQNPDIQLQLHELSAQIKKENGSSNQAEKDEADLLRSKIRSIRLLAMNVDSFRAHAKDMLSSIEIVKEQFKNECTAAVDLLAKAEALKHTIYTNNAFFEVRAMGEFPELGIKEAYRRKEWEHASYFTISTKKQALIIHDFVSALRNNIEVRRGKK